MGARNDSGDVALACGLLATADPSALTDFLEVVIGPLRVRGDSDELLTAVVSEVRYRSARAASAVLGVLPKTVIQRRRRAVTAAGLDDEPFERLLLVTAALASVDMPGRRVSPKSANGSSCSAVIGEPQQALILAERAVDE